MTTIRFRHAALVVAALAAGPALAQGTAPAPNPAANPAPSASLAAPAVTSARPSLDRVERHIADLHRRLAITAAQQPQWDVFAGVMRQNAQRMQAAYAERAAKVASLSAPDDMRSYAELARAHADDVQRLVPAFDALYATMTPEQKATADKTFQQFQGRGERGRRS